MKNPLLRKKNIRKVTTFFNTDSGIRYIPYGLGARYISWICRKKKVQRRFFGKKLPIIREFLESFPGRWDEEEMMAGFFTLNYLHGWRSSSISNMRDFNFRRRSRIHGMESFKRAYDKGKGVILLGSHYGLPAVSFSSIPRLGFKDFHTILGEKGAGSVKFKGIRPSLQPKILVFKRQGESDAFSLLFEAKEVLEQGHILHLLGDGGHGRASHNLSFLGKVKAYRSTFAELSLLTGAPIIPIFITPSGGKIDIVFEKAVESGDETMEREERVRIILENYSALLEQKWMENPSFINGGFMEMYNRQIPYQEEG
jgi:lauroyl/myristoyl acyltransferase